MGQQELQGRHVWDRWVKCKEVQLSRRGWYMKERQGKEGWEWGLRPDSGHLAKELVLTRAVCGQRCESLVGC